MTDPTAARSPLASFGTPATHDGADVALAEQPCRAKFVLRGTVEASFLDTVAGALGVVPPVAPNTAAEGDEATLLWLGPDEWLVVGTADLAARLDAALAGRHAALVDVTDARTVIRVMGAGAPHLIAQGCGVDLHPRVFAGVAQAPLAKVDVLLHRVDGGPDTPAFDLYVARSFAEHLWRWLAQAAG